MPPTSLTILSVPGANVQKTTECHRRIAVYYIGSLAYLLIAGLVGKMDTNTDI